MIRNPDYRGELIPSSWVEEERPTQKYYEHETIDLGQVEEIDECMFSHCTFLGEARLTFMDVTFEMCDFTRANYCGSSLIRVLFQSCNFVGMELSNVILKEVTVKESKAMYWNLSGSKMELVAFHDTDLSHSGMGMLKWKGLYFDHCKLDESEFLGTPMKNLDLSTCSMEQLFVAPEDLRGVVIDSSQALSLIAYFGIQIKE